MQFRVKKSYIFLHIPFFYSTFAAVFEPRSIIFIHFFAVYCYGNRLFKHLKRPVRGVTQNPVEIYHHSQRGTRGKSQQPTCVSSDWCAS